MTTVLAPCKASVAGVLVRVLVKLPVVIGSKEPKARWMAFFGVSMLSF